MRTRTLPKYLAQIYAVASFHLLRWRSTQSRLLIFSSGAQIYAVASFHLLQCRCTQSRLFIFSSGAQIYAVASFHLLQWRSTQSRLFISSSGAQIYAVTSFHLLQLGGRYQLQPTEENCTQLNAGIPLKSARIPAVHTRHTAVRSKACGHVTRGGWTSSSARHILTFNVFISDDGCSKFYNNSNNGNL